PNGGNPPPHRPLRAAAAPPADRRSGRPAVCGRPYRTTSGQCRQRRGGCHLRHRCGRAGAEQCGRFTISPEGVGGVPRPERVIDPADGVVARFAVELRKLRQAAGNPAYRELARRVHYSAATLAEAAAGNRLPTLAVTLAYVAAC